MVWSKGIVCLLLSFHDSAVWLLVLDPDPLESLHSSSLGMSKELPSRYAMKTLEEQGTLSEQPLMKGVCHMPCSCDSYC